MRRFSTRGRLWLGLVASILAAGDIWLLAYPRAAETQMFRLRLTNDAVVIGPRIALSEYDPTTRTWSYRGKRLAQIDQHMIVHDFDIHGRGSRYLIMSLRGPATAASAVAAMNALVDAGICDFAMLDHTLDRRSAEELNIARIEWVIDEKGHQRACSPRGSSLSSSRA